MVSTRLTFFSYALSAQAAVVMLAETKEVLYEKNAEKKMSMASTTKIMTALLAVESGRLDETVTVTEKMVRVEGTSMGLRAGDKLTLLNIVKGMMLLSGNDAANAVAIFLAGSLENFAEKMNEKARNIGMKNTNFVTPSGLDDDEHYTTAYDMARLASYAMENEAFRSCVSQYSASVEYISPDVSYTYRNHNRFLTMYEGACGVKTGFTKKSGRCLVTAVDNNGCLIVAVTLNAPDDWNDHIKLYSDCIPVIVSKTFKNEFDCRLSVVGGSKAEVKASVSQEIITHTKNENVRTVLLTEKLVYAPVEKGEILGVVRVYLGENGEIMHEYPVCALENIEIKESPQNRGALYKIKELFRRFERWLITA